jgi:hypothetical protein
LERRAEEAEAAAEGGEGAAAAVRGWGPAGLDAALLLLLMGCEDRGVAGPSLLLLPLLLLGAER